MKRSEMIAHLAEFIATSIRVPPKIALTEAQQILGYLEMMGMQPPPYQDVLYGTTVDNFFVSEWEHEEPFVDTETDI